MRRLAWLWLAIAAGALAAPPEPVHVELTGHDLPPGLLQLAFANAVCGAMPGRRVRVEPPAVALPAPGGTARVTAHAAVEVPGQPSAELDLPVDVSVGTWRDEPARWLLASNDPESVRQPRMLHRGRLDDGRSRLFYHHLNATGTPLTFAVKLVNPGAAPARVHVRDAHAGPTPYAEYAGHLAAKRYWEQRLAGQGVVLTLPPRSGWTLTAVTCGPRDVLSGLAELAPLAASGLEVRVDATTEAVEPGPCLAPPLDVPFAEMYRYRDPDTRATAVYEPPLPYGVLTLGREPLDSLLGPPLLGRYGAVSEFSLELRNPGALPAHDEVVVSADGGGALATVVVDGLLMETGLIAGGTRQRLLDVVLAPGETRQLKLRTMPESGSNYPVRLIARPYQPEPERKGP